MCLLDILRKTSHIYFIFSYFLYETSRAKRLVATLTLSLLILPTWKTTLDFSSRYVLMLAPMIR